MVYIFDYVFWPNILMSLIKVIKKMEAINKKLYFSFHSKPLKTFFQKLKKCRN